jgi:hypothetical protein
LGVTNHSVQGVTEKKNPVTGRQKGFDKKQTNRNMFSRCENMFLAKLFYGLFGYVCDEHDTTGCTGRAASSAARYEGVVGEYGALVCSREEDEE